MSARLVDANFDGWPIEEFARSIGARSLAMLTAFLDDTGTHAGSPVIGVLGMVSNSMHWARIEFSWKSKLKAKGLSCFHAVDCEHGNGEFEHMQSPDRLALWRELLGTVATNRAVIVGSAVVREAWDGLPAAVKAWYKDDPIYFCFEHCMQQLSAWSKAAQFSQPVAIVFAEQQQHQSTVGRLHDYYRRSAYFSNLGSFAVAKPQCVVPLQCADLIAHASYRHLVSSNNGQPQGEKVTLVVQSGIPNMSRYHDSDSLAEVLREGPKSFNETMTASAASARSF